MCRVLDLEGFHFWVWVLSLRRLKSLGCRVFQVWGARLLGEGY